MPYIGYRMAKVGLLPGTRKPAWAFHRFDEHPGLYNWHQQAYRALYWAKDGRNWVLNQVQDGRHGPFIGYDKHNWRKAYCLGLCRAQDRALHHIQGSRHGPCTNYESHARPFIGCWKASCALIQDIGNLPRPFARYQATTMGLSSVLTAILVLESGVIQPYWVLYRPQLYQTGPYTRYKTVNMGLSSVMTLILGFIMAQEND